MKTGLLAGVILAGSAGGHAGKATSDQLTSRLPTIRSAALLAACLLAAHPAAAENINPARGQFIASRTWFQLGGDKEESLFRSYAVLVTDGNPIDFPNLFVMSCPRDGKPYVTLHFPPNYALKGFGPDTWLPKTDLAVRSAGGTFSFDAELNANEFHVDLGETEFDYLQEIWAADGPVDLKLGPAIRRGFGLRPDRGHDAQHVRRIRPTINVQLRFLGDAYALPRFGEVLGKLHRIGKSSDR